MTDKINYDELELPNYANTRPVVANLNITDLVKAAVLPPLNVLLVGGVWDRISRANTNYAIIC